MELDLFLKQLFQVTLTPDFSYFPAHPAIMLSQSTTINTKYFDILIKMRLEGNKYIPVRSVFMDM